MAESILNHKKLLVVDDEPDTLDTVREEILQLLSQGQGRHGKPP